MEGRWENRIKENILIFHHFSCLFFSISVIILSSPSFYFKDFVWLTDVFHVPILSYIILFLYGAGSSDAWNRLPGRNGQPIPSHSINISLFLKSIMLKWTFIAKGHNNFIFGKFRSFIWTCMEASDECNLTIPSYSHNYLIHRKPTPMNIIIAYPNFTYPNPSQDNNNCANKVKY